MFCLLQAENTADCDDQTLDWTTLCNRVLGRDVSIWAEFLQPLFLSRAKVLCAARTVTLDAIFEHLLQSMLTESCYMC